MPNRSQRRAMYRAFGNLLKNDKLISSLPSTVTSRPGSDPIIAEYLAWRKLHPHGPLPKSLTDKMAAATRGVDLERVGRNFVRDIVAGGSNLSHQPDDGRTEE